jgi:zinc protease
MRLIKHIRYLPFLSLIFLANISRASFPQDTSDLKADPEVVFGQLDNGVRYVIEPNHEPKDRISLRMLVLSGSLMEKESQRGLAHYLEHMAFNGSLHHPPGTLVEYFQRLGMSFGGDTNAYTTFDRTVYKIELPDTKPTTIKEGLEVFSDMADKLLLTPEMITKEKPIILSEKRARDSASYREFVNSFEFLLPSSLLPKRLPIGETPVIEHATREQFLDLYQTWYRPERIIVIVSGDTRKEAIEPVLKNTFSTVTTHGKAAPEPNLGTIQPFKGLKTRFDPQPDASSTHVSINIISPYHEEPDSVKQRTDRFIRDIACSILNRRLAILAKKENAPFNEAEVNIEENYQFFKAASILLTSDPKRWQNSLEVAEQELRRALDYGFSKSELSEIVATIQNDLNQAVASRSTRHSSEIADALVDSLASKQVYTSPEQDLALYGPILKSLTPDACLQALRTSFPSSGRSIVVSGNTSITGDANKQIEQIYLESSKVKLSPPDGIKTANFAYTQFGTPGQVTKNRKVQDLDLSLIEFSNGVKLNFKKTPFEANRIRLSVRIGGGKLTEPKSKPGLSLYSDLTFTLGGLGKHSLDDLERIMAGKTVGASFRVNSDAFSFSGVTNKNDLLLEFQLLAATITDPGYRPEAARVARKHIDELYTSIYHSPEGPLETIIARKIAGDDPRFGLPEKHFILERNLNEVKAWLTPEFNHGPIEITVVGDIDEKSVIDAVSQTLAALPQREEKPDYATSRIIKTPSEVFSENLTIESEIPKAIVQLNWLTDDYKNVYRTRRLNLLAEIMMDRLRIKIREQLGGAYSPEAFSQPSDTFTHFGVFTAECIVAPEQAALIAETIRSISYDLCTHGVTEDELQRAKQPILTSIKQSVRTNPYWLLSVLENCQEVPDRLEWSRSRQKDIESATKQEIDALAKRYLSPDKAFQAIVRPIKPGQ